MTRDEFEAALLDLLGRDAPGRSVAAILAAAEGSASYGRVLEAVSSGQRIVAYIAGVAREQQQRKVAGTGGRA